MNKTMQYRLFSNTRTLIPRRHPIYVLIWAYGSIKLLVGRNTLVDFCRIYFVNLCSRSVYSQRLLCSQNPVFNVHFKD